MRLPYCDMPPCHTSVSACGCVAVQLYGCNVLNLGNSKVLSVHANTARQIVRDPKFKGEVQVVNFTPITSMYGAVHCSSQVSTLPVIAHCASNCSLLDFLIWLEGSNFSAVSALLLPPIFLLSATSIRLPLLLD